MTFLLIRRGLSVLVLLGGCAASNAGDGALLQTERHLGHLRGQVESARSELHIVERGGLYLVVDSEHGELILKAKGSELLRIPSVMARAPDPAQECREAVLSSIQDRRPRPRWAQRGPVEYPATSVARMPRRYRLRFDCSPGSGETVLELRPLSGLSAYAGWRRIMRFFDGGGLNHNVFVAAPDAQRLYWSLEEGMAVVFR